MFGIIKDVCKVCQEERESDLVAHGLGVCVIMYYPCNHQMKATKDKTVWTLHGSTEVLLEENK